MTRQEIRFSGFGGQGIILAGYVVGKAATLYTDLNATLTQSYGPESRGGACAAQLILADEPVHFPHLITPNILIAMSQEAYDKYAGEIDPDGCILIDKTLVEPGTVAYRAPLWSVPATHIAQELGRVIVANIVMLGFFVGITELIDADTMRRTILESVPKGTEDLNHTAFTRGLAVAQRLKIEA